MPATSATVAAELGLRCGAFDLNAACSGFTYAMVVAHGLIAIGAERILVIGTDTLARITDWEDRNTAVLFADGSGAVVLEAVDGRGQLLGWDLDADGSAERYLYAEVGGNIQMDGKEVFRRAVRIMVDSAEKSMAAAGVTADDIALVVPHQANIRIIEAACDRLGIADGPGRRRARPHRQHVVGVSIPLALVDAIDNDRVKRGRPRAARRLRRRHDRGQRAASAGAATRRERRRPHRPGHGRLAGHRPGDRPPLRTPSATGSRSPTARPTRRRGCSRVKCDVTSAIDVDEAFKAVEEHFGGPVEVLVSNAGMTKDRLLLRMSEDDFTSVIDANLTAAFRVAKRAAQGMLRAREGRIVLVSSVVGLLGSAGQANYAAVEGRPGRASPGRWPASSARAASPSTSWRPGRSRPT